ncbi:MAG: Fic family protein [Parasphingorhabdus sp.]|jgi:Fic family protein
MYLWEQNDWPNITWDEKKLATLLAKVSRKQGRLLGRMEALGFELRREANLRILTDDVVKSSEIEGENLDPDQVRSSIARRLGMDIGGLIPADRDVEGIVEMMLDATGYCSKKLTEARLFDWHASLFPIGRSGMSKIVVGNLRDDSSGPMRVVSGAIGKEKVHYQAPPAKRVPTEMKIFLKWFAKPGDIDPLIVSGLAHLWFVTIHPFEDGNGRIARAIADMALARSEKSGQRFYSMSAQIRHDRKDYYNILERTQKGDLDVTRWMEWFLNCLDHTIEGAQGALSAVLYKAQFWDRFAKEPLNERQIKILNKLLDGFEGKLTTSKWAKISKCSQDTAYRDILGLVGRGALQKDSGGGRSTSYSLIIPC